MQPTTPLLNGFLEALTVAATGLLDATLCYVGLAQGITQQSPRSSTTAANITPCTGSLALGVTIGPLLGPYPLADGSAVLEGEQLRFSPSTSTDNQQVGAWWIGNAATVGTLLAYEVFPTPIPLVAGGDPLTLIPRLSLTPQAMGSVSVAYDG